MQPQCERASRTSIRAFRAYEDLIIVAEGELPSPGFQVDIRQNPIRIFPPQFDLLRCPLPGFFPQVITPFRYSETVRYPADQPTVTVHHADGEDEIEIEASGPELSPYAEAVRGRTDPVCPDDADRATGFSKNLSFDEAFADALSKLPPLDVRGADILSRVTVVEVGGLFGGIAGFNDLFVSICRTHDG